RSILARDPLVRVVDLVAERIQALLPTASVCVCSVDALDGGTMQAFVRTPGAGGTTAVAAVSPEWRRTLAATAMQARWLPLPADASHPPEATLVRAGASEAFVHPFGGDEDSRSWLVLAVPVEHKPATAPL